MRDVHEWENTGVLVMRIEWRKANMLRCTKCDSIWHIADKEMVGKDHNQTIRKSVYKHTMFKCREKEKRK